MKILLLDIETAPNTVHVWGLWKQNVGTNQIIASGYVMCWSAQWLGEKKIHFDSFVKSGRKRMLWRVHKLLEEADAVVHFNGKRFDVPTLNKEFIIHDIPPPSPSKPIDLLLVARRRFRFPSNKLDYISDVLGAGHKMRHKGHQLWIDCMAKDPAAWKTMERYNRQDVRLLGKVYRKMLPWIENHPNFGTFDNTGGCPNCGSERYQSRGFSCTAALKYRRYQCLDCRGWFRSAKTVTERTQERFRAAL